jgi:hypothetical protein
MRRKKVERKDKPVQERWVVCDPVDCRVSKYPPAVGMTDEDVHGFEFSHAQELAAAVTGQKRWEVVRLRAWRLARAGGEPVSAVTAETALTRADVEVSDGQAS